MVSGEPWSARAIEALVAEQRRRPDPTTGRSTTHVVNANRFEVTFFPSHLDHREVTLVIDGEQPFAADFVVDAPAEKGRPINTFGVEEVAWRIYLLGMREPFSPKELARDESGRDLRFVTEAP